MAHLQLVQLFTSFFVMLHLVTSMTSILSDSIGQNRRSNTECRWMVFSMMRVFVMKSFISVFTASNRGSWLPRSVKVSTTRWKSELSLMTLLDSGRINESKNASSDGKHGIVEVETPVVIVLILVLCRRHMVHFLCCLYAVFRKGWCSVLDLSTHVFSVSAPF